jgi:hypothetical protein
MIILSFERVQPMNIKKGSLSSHVCVHSLHTCRVSKENDMPSVKIRPISSTLIPGLVLRVHGSSILPAATA